MSLIDTHCHLDNIKYIDDIDEVIENALNNGIKSFLIPGADFKDLPRAVSLAEKYDSIFFAVGIHPYDCENYDLKIFEKYISHPKCIAIGECGLDYYRLPKDEDEKLKNIQLQKEVFISQINFAKKVKKPLIIHIRDASNDSKKILIDYEAKKVGGVLHCFNADSNLLELVNHNFYFGIGGVVTFKNAKKLIEILPKIQLDKLVLETDAPYLTPHPFRGTGNEPKYVDLISLKISEILKIEKNEFNITTTRNAKQLFKQLF